MPRVILPITLILLLVVAMLPTPGQARLFIDITRGHMQPLPIALPQFGADGDESASYGSKILGVVAADLERSGLFRPIDPRSYIEKIAYGQVIPQFPDWRQISAQALVSGNIQNLPNGQLKIGFRLWDTYAEKQVAGKEFSTEKRNWRRVAHLVADEIYSRLTGESGYFDTRIVYISETGPAKKRIKRLAIMDQDGANHKFLTNGSALVLTPRFSPNTQTILYMSYAQGTPRVYLRDLQTGREELVGRFRGMSFAPRFSFDGNKIIMSIADNGNTEIFEMDLRSRRQRQLTNSPGIDTSPSYSPDGSQIVFNSDRGGSQQLYVMKSDGSNVRRISFGDGKYGTPVWSPRGDLIAFTKMHKGRFHIGVMRTDGSGERLLTDSYLDEGPTWSPNGRVIMFTRQERTRGKQPGRVRLYSIDVTGYNEREVVSPADASDPAWSPLLPM